MFDSDAGTEAEVTAVDALLRLVACDVSSCDAAGLAVVSGHIRRVQGFLDASTAAVAQRAAALHAEGRSARPSEVLARSGRMSTRDAKKVERRAAALSKTPGLSGALASGDITGSHADAVANATSGMNDEARDLFFGMDRQLTARAVTSSPERFADYCKVLARRLTEDDGLSQFEQQRRETRLRKYLNPITGMYVINGQFDPELGAKIFAAIDAEVEALWRAKHPEQAAGIVPTLGDDIEHLAAHAVGNLVAGGHATKHPREAEITVLIDWESLRDGFHEHTVCEFGDGTRIPVSTARRLACDARILPVVLGGAGEVLDLGRTERLANRGQRRALRAMYRTCAWQGCTTSFSHCRIHHIEPWDLMGPTDLGKMLPLCTMHHHMVHEGRWAISLDRIRTLTIRRPDGVLHAVVPLPRLDGREPNRSKTAPGPPPRTGEPSDVPLAS
jgi:hypothetical protein